MKTLKNIVLLAGMLLISSGLFAQNRATSDSTDTDDEEEKEALIDRLVFGLTPNIQLGTFTFISMMPYVGYKLTDRWQVALSGTYMYQSMRYTPTSPRYSTSAYGASVFTRLYIMEELFAHAEYESINTEYYDEYQAKIMRRWIPGALIGAGYRYGGGGRGGAFISAMYNFMYDPQRSPYASPLVIRAGVEF